MSQARKKPSVIECFKQGDFPGYRPLPEDMVTIESMAARVGKFEPLETINLEPRKVTRNAALRLGKAALSSWYTRDFAILSVDSVIKGDDCIKAAQNRLQTFSNLTGNGFVFGYGSREFASIDNERAERLLEILNGLGVPVALITNEARQVVTAVEHEEPLNSQQLAVV
jgi:hypothetical protein